MRLFISFKSKKKVFIVIGLILGLLIYINYMNGVVDNLNTKANITSEFQNTLFSYNISTSGPDSILSKEQLMGLIDEITTKDYSIIERYTEKLKKDNNTITITSFEMVELYFYSLLSNEQSEFLKKASNQNVSVSMSNNSILLSYNVSKYE